MYTFIIFAIFMLIALTIVYFALPESLNSRHEVDSQEQLGTRSRSQDHTHEYCEQQKCISYSMFLFNKRSMFSFLSCILICIFSSFYSAFLSLQVQEYGLSGS